jgi:glycosyltransferase involved in cell wall biosynthesis
LQECARILATPPLPPAGLEFLLKNARGLLYPSFNEGFGYPPLEAMSLGVPCVVSNQTSIPEVCGTAAVYCDPFSIDSVATAIKELLSSPADSESLKAHAEKIRRRQSSDLRKLCELVLDEPPRPVYQRLNCGLISKERANGELPEVFVQSKQTL